MGLFFLTDIHGILDDVVVTSLTRYEPREVNMSRYLNCGGITSIQRKALRTWDLDGEKIVS